jgi:hypothetical protein
MPPCTALLCEQRINEPPARVVARARVLGPGIAEADDELER